MKKGKLLRGGDTVGIVAPASGTNEENLKNCVSKLEKWGLKVIMGGSCFGNSHKKYLAAEDFIRANDINEFFNEKEINGILCLRGGYGSGRILNHINYKTINRNPKIFIGYSDITALHIAINQKSQLITYHGPMAVDIGNDMDSLTEKRFFDAIMRNQPLIVNEELYPLRRGIGKGVLVGGNLSLIISSLGTPYEIETRNKILFMEEINEELYKIDRMLNQLKLAGKLKCIAGMVLGSFKASSREDGYDEELIKLFNDILPNNVPVVYGLKAGHTIPNMTLAMGGMVRITSTEKEISIRELIK